MMSLQWETGQVAYTHVYGPDGTVSMLKGYLQQWRPTRVSGMAIMRHMTDEHTTAEDVGRMAAAAGVKQLVLTHVIPGGDEPDSFYTDAVKRHYKGPVTVARDLMSF
jgi:hypothetical protein